MESQKTATALESINNSRQDKELDVDTAQKALQQLSSTNQALNQKPKIQIREEDIKFLMNELEIERHEAEKALISHGGDIRQTLYNLVIS